jgi:hypothetical protein
MSNTTSLKQSKIVSQRRQVGDTTTETYALTVFFWLEVPNSMSFEEALTAQVHHGPFKSIAEAEENQRLVLLGGERVQWRSPST